MPNFIVLLFGELKRMVKYKIAAASVVVALIWIGVLYLVEVSDITFFLPLLLFFDCTTMAILMVGVTIFFEKQEGSLRTILVTPINKTDYLLTKVLVTVCASVLTLALLYLYTVIFKPVSLNILALLGAVILVALFHSLIGLILSYYSKDFTSLLMNMFVYILIFLVLPVLEHVNLLQHNLTVKLLYLAPTKAAMILLYASAETTLVGDLIYALLYMVIGSLVLFIFALKLFDSFAAREGGV